MCFKRFSDQHMFTQLDTDPTRGDNHLDVILVSEDGLLLDPEVTVNKILSDHNTISFKIDSKFVNSPEDDDNMPENSLDKVDQNFVDETRWNRMNLFINNVDWNEELKDKDTNASWEMLSNKIIEAINIFAPLKKGFTENFNEGHKETQDVKPRKKKSIPHD